MLEIAKLAWWWKPPVDATEAKESDALRDFEQQLAALTSESHGALKLWETLWKPGELGSMSSNLFEADMTLNGDEGTEKKLNSKADEGKTRTQADDFYVFLRPCERWATGSQCIDFNSSRLDYSLGCCGDGVCASDIDPSAWENSQYCPMDCKPTGRP